MYENIPGKIYRIIGSYISNSFRHLPPDMIVLPEDFIKNSGLSRFLTATADPKDNNKSINYLTTEGVPTIEVVSTASFSKKQQEKLARLASGKRTPIILGRKTTYRGFGEIHVWELDVPHLHPALPE